jgi:hypothetical protein
MNAIYIPGKANTFLIHTFQTGSGAYTVPYQMDTWGSFLAGRGDSRHGLKLFTEICLVVSLERYIRFPYCLLLPW